MTDEPAEDTDPPLDQVGRRARRRWLLSLVGSGLAGGVGGPLLHGVLGDRPPHARPHGSAAIVGAAVVLLTALVVLVVISRGAWRGKGRFAPPLVAGLRRAQRRQAAKAVRRGEPSPEPLLRHVEHDLAERTVRHARSSTAILCIAAGGELLEAVLQDRTAARLFFAAGATLLMFALGLQWRTLRGSRRYLALDASEN